MGNRSLTENKNLIISTFEAIKNAIIGKGVTPSGDPTTYSTAISQISGGGGTDVSDTTASIYDVAGDKKFYTKDGVRRSGALWRRTIANEDEGIYVGLDYKTLYVAQGIYGRNDSTMGGRKSFITEQMSNVFPAISGEMQFSDPSVTASESDPTMQVGASITPTGWANGEDSINGSNTVHLAQYASQLGVTSDKIIEGETILGVEGTATTGGGCASGVINVSNSTAFDIDTGLSSIDVITFLWLPKAYTSSNCYSETFFYDKRLNASSAFVTLKRGTSASEMSFAYVACPFSSNPAYSFVVKAINGGIMTVKAGTQTNWSSGKLYWSAMTVVDTQSDPTDPDGGLS